MEPAHFDLPPQGATVSKSAQRLGRLPGESGDHDYHLGGLLDKPELIVHFTGTRPPRYPAPAWIMTAKPYL
jgi:hypothetical protein